MKEDVKVRIVICNKYNFRFQNENKNVLEDEIMGAKKCEKNNSEHAYLSNYQIDFSKTCYYLDFDISTPTEKIIKEFYKESNRLKELREIIC
jgi:hypothetical protein